MSRRRSAAARFILENSLLLLAGTVAAVAWANIDHDSYDHLAHPLHFWVNDVGMVFFFALAAKEVFEATLPGGPLASPRRALSPLAAAVGGMIAPALIYVGLATLRGPAELARGWAIPCATDIAFSAMIARIIFPTGHPAVPFLLLLAIADDALGLIILAVFYPSGALSFTALGVLMTAAVLSALWLRRRQIRSFWPYVLGPGVTLVGRAVLGRLSSCPRAGSDRAVHAPRRPRPGTLRTRRAPSAGYAQSIRALVGDAGAVRPAPLRLCERGRSRSPRSGRARTTWWRRSCSESRWESSSCPQSLVWLAHICRQGCGAGIYWWWAWPLAIGFTVSLFFATAAFPPGAALDETKMGALLSFIAAPIAIGLSRILPRLSK